LTLPHDIRNKFDLKKIPLNNVKPYDLKIMARLIKTLIKTKSEKPVLQDLTEKPGVELECITDD
jgi:hypothetical protein